MKHQGGPAAATQAHARSYSRDGAAWHETASGLRISGRPRVARLSYGGTAVADGSCSESPSRPDRISVRRPPSLLLARFFCSGPQHPARKTPFSQTCFAARESVSSPTSRGRDVRNHHDADSGCKADQADSLTSFSLRSLKPEDRETRRVGGEGARCGRIGPASRHVAQPSTVSRPESNTEHPNISTAVHLTLRNTLLSRFRRTGFCTLRLLHRGLFPSSSFSAPGPL